MSKSLLIKPLLTFECFEVAEKKKIIKQCDTEEKYRVS